MHVACRYERETADLAQLAQPGETRAVVRSLQQLRRNPGTAGEAFGEAPRMPGIALFMRSQENETAGQPAVQIAPTERIAAFLRPASTAGDEIGQIAVAFAVRGEQHQPGTVLQPYLRSDDQRQADVFRRDMRPHGSGERTLVGERERPVAEP